MAAAHLERADDVVGVAGDHDADRHVTVVGRIGRICAARRRVEANLAPDDAPQIVLERRRDGERLHTGGVFMRRRLPRPVP